MLIKSKVLERIKAGEISLMFRRWKKRGVKAGGTQMTQRGVIGIDAVDVVAESSITEKDARAAGFESRTELVESMPPDETGLEVYRIEVHWVCEDPRKALRNDADL